MSVSLAFVPFQPFSLLPKQSKDGRFGGHCWDEKKEQLVPGFQYISLILLAATVPVVKFFYCKSCSCIQGKWAAFYIFALATAVAGPDMGVLLWLH